MTPFGRRTPSPPASQIADERHNDEGCGPKRRPDQDRERQQDARRELQEIAELHRPPPIASVPRELLFDFLQQRISLGPQPGFPSRAFPGHLSFRIREVAFDRRDLVFVLGINHVG